MSDFNYIFYGTEANAEEVRNFTEHIIANNIKTETDGGAKAPICIWGTHGIGKTALVEEIAKENDYKFTYIAPAQFEEMGDLIGMPTIEGDTTNFKRPEWVPTEEGPGILLIDDVNRADDRILRGIMQLLQNYELVSWKLPADWQIVLTANPDGGDYSVTPMDDAMLTRMMHVTMRFDPKAWAVWAERSNVDSRGINFVLTYPEITQGRRTTPRSLVQFFRSIEPIKNLKSDLNMVQMLGASCLDEETVAAFITFVQQNLTELVSPEEICNASDFKSQIENPIIKIKAISVSFLRSTFFDVINQHIRKFYSTLLSKNSYFIFKPHYIRCNNILLISASAITIFSAAFGEETISCNKAKRKSFGTKSILMKACIFFNCFGFGFNLLKVK